MAHFFGPFLTSPSKVVWYDECISASSIGAELRVEVRTTRRTEVLNNTLPWLLTVHSHFGQRDRSAIQAR
ncbi:hypothetical protein CEE69_20990 [Rhodopirellula bahusiensis]|uniref:Uncharacterized protein n=1 Tax=Rhodopirellula bahusiensis TaxID=2014065 RepID=A0A2G1W2M2_9BACT|nr:hypothetical protein CEE69_20990 [Rhodopirellula bahusiensis]